MSSYHTQQTSRQRSAARLALAALGLLALAAPARGLDTIVTIVGGGLSSDPLQAGIGSPTAVVLALDNTLYWAAGNNVLARRSDGTLVVVAGTNGSGFSGDGGPATAATLSGVSGLALDAHGNLFISDSRNLRIRKIAAATGIISTVAGGGASAADGVAATTAHLNYPGGIALDAAGNLFFADLNGPRVRRVDAASGIITTVAGTGVFPPSGAPTGDGGPATAATLAVPSAVAVDASGNLYIADEYASTVRVVRAATGVISTVAGTGSQRFSGDGATATAAALHSPQALAVTAAGVIYVSDTGNGRVRRIAANGIISTVAGAAGSSFNGDGIPATAANLGSPYGVTLDSAENLYIADFDNHRIRAVAASSGLITTVAGNGANGYSGDGHPATSTQFSLIGGIAYGPGGDLYIVAQGDNRICRVAAATGIVSTVAGTGNFGFSGDGGPATAADLADPARIAFDHAGNLLIVDQLNNRIRRVDAATGIITTIAGSGNSSLSPFPTLTFAGDGGPATAAVFNQPVGLLVLGNGDLLVTDMVNQRVRRIAAATGIITTICGIGQPPFAGGQVQGGFSGDGGPATSAALNVPVDLQVDQAGNILIDDLRNNRVRRIAAADGTISTIAGNGTAISTTATGDGGLATAAILYNPTALLIDAHGDLLISVGNDNDAIRRVDHATGVITTIAGSGSRGFSGDGGPATLARLDRPTTTALDPAGNLVISDGDNFRVRKLLPVPLLAAEQPAGALPGLVYSYFEGGWNALPDLSSLAPLATGSAAQISLAPRLRDTLYALRFTGYVFVPADGTYTFSTTSDDGSRLRVGGVLVVDNDGKHAAQERSGSIGLAAGLHALTVDYFQNGGGATLAVTYAGPGVAKQAIPASALFHPGVGLVPAEHPGAIQPGLTYAYAEGTWSALPDFATLAPTATGTAAQVDLTPRRRDTLYALRFTGYVAVPVDGQYTFATTSDDGSSLAVGGVLVVDNDGKHPAQRRIGAIGLQAGLHAIAVEYFQGSGGATLGVTWSGPGFTEQAIPASAWSHAQPVGGGILREFWTGVPGKTVASLTSWPAFPLSPSGTSLQPAFVAPSNWADTYGTRMRGYVTAPLSGAYTFWIAGDDQCELWLSPFTGLEQDKLLIASVPSATAQLAWDTFPQQRSATITLTAGQSYYIEALQKEAFGGDCLAVGWQLPDATFERPIPGPRLTPALVGSARLEHASAGTAGPQSPR